MNVGTAILFLTFSGFASTGLGRASASTPERRPATEGVRPTVTAGPCAGLSGRLSTLPCRLWQAPGRGSAAIALAVSALAAWSGAARADELGDRIAEALCYPPSARHLALTQEEEAAYRRSDRLAGDYRDIQGADARAWFAKAPGSAECRTPADGRLTLFFCASVTQSDDLLSREPRRLCP